MSITDMWVMTTRCDTLAEQTVQASTLPPHRFHTGFEWDSRMERPSRVSEKQRSILQFSLEQMCVLEDIRPGGA